MRSPGGIPACPLPAAGILVALLAFFLTLFSPLRAWADGISGYGELTYSNINATDRPTTAAETKTHVDSLVQRYNLSLGRSLYPNVLLNAGVIVERDTADSTTNGTENTSGSTRISPSATLSIGNPFISSGLGYARNEVTTSSSGAPSSTEVLESYDARLSMRPEGLPTATLLFSRTNSFNVNTAIRDTTTDSYSLSLRYLPVRNLDLGYQGSLTDTTDKVNSVESENITNSVMASYADRFLANRVSFFSSGTVTDSEATFSSSGAGVVTTLLPRLAGFFALSDNPAFIQLSLDNSLNPPVITWTSVPTLIDGNKQAATNPLINLGIQPVIGGETRQRNIGLDLAVTATVSTIYVYVNQNLPASIANQFTWAVYTSSDNENWTLQQNVIQSVVFEQIFDPLLQALVQRFTINTANITTRYIKVVTRPLPQQPPPLPTGVDLNNILVTEMEAAVRVPAAQIPSQKTTSQSALLSSGIKALLLNNPSLPLVTYDLNASYNYSRGNTGTTSYNMLVSNGLSASKQFNAYINGSARLSREDSYATDQSHSGAFTYSVSLDAHPLRTLSHNLTYSGRQADVGGKHTTSDSLFLTTSAALYEGLSVSVAGGVSTGTNQNGVKDESEMVTCGVNIIPHPTLSMNLSYSGVWSKSTGGGRADSNSSSSSGSYQVGYNPLPSLSLFFSIGFNSSSLSPTVVTQSYGGGWSPFRDGALQFNVAYNESLTSTQDLRTRSISPALRWNIRSGWWLDVSYAYQTTSSNIDETWLNVVTTTLRISF